MRRLLLTALLVASACQGGSPSVATSEQAVVTDCLPVGTYCSELATPLPVPKAYLGGALPATAPGTVLIGYPDGQGNRTYYAAHPAGWTVQWAREVGPGKLATFFDEADLAGVPAVPLPQPPRPPRMDEILEFAFRYLEAVANTNEVNAACSALWGVP